MKIGVIILSLCCVFDASFAQKIKNDFFAFHNMIAEDSTYDSVDKQIGLVKSAGYDGIEINDHDNFDEMKTALDKHAFKASFFYVQISLEPPYMEDRLEDHIGQLKGSKTIIAPFIVSKSKSFPGDPEADTLLIRLMRQLADWADKSGLQVAIYPHFGLYVARSDQALSIIKAVHRKNLGLSFNLCHWLATTQPQERSQLKPLLKELSPYLKMITICGANDVVSPKPTLWDDYILPLGTGSFDTYGLLKYCLLDLRLSVPIGVQCFNIKTDHYQLVQNTMLVWKQYKKRLTAGK
jgi:sugar phosphate isomerase/epimerase